jgi:hypothetical protein
VSVPCPAGMAVAAGITRLQSVSVLACQRARLWLQSLPRSGWSTTGCGPTRRGVPRRSPSSSVRRPPNLAHGWTVARNGLTFACNRHVDANNQTSICNSDTATHTDLLVHAKFVSLSLPLLPCSGVHHWAGVRGRQPADPAGGAAVQRAGLDVLALRGCAAAPSGRDTCFAVLQI